MRLSVGQSVEFAGAKATQDRKFALSVLVVDLNHAPDEELLLFRSPSLPIVRLRDSHGKSLVACPFLLLRLFLVLWAEMHVVLDGRKILHRPRLADREGAICILSCLVQLDSTSVADGDHDNAGLLVRRGGSGRRWGLGIGTIFLDANMRDVRLLD